jgi:hypothetical protein
MPLHALALKENRRRWSPVSKIADKEDSTALLRDSEELSVKHSVGEPIPAFPQRSEDGSKIPSAVRRQDAGNIFPDDPARANSIKEAHALEGQLAASAIQPRSVSSDGEILTGCAGDEEVDRLR